MFTFIQIDFTTQNFRDELADIKQEIQCKVMQTPKKNLSSIKNEDDNVSSWFFLI